jgi:hypothetical protein
MALHRKRARRKKLIPRLGAQAALSLRARKGGIMQDRRTKRRRTRAAQTAEAIEESKAEK